MRKTLSRVVGCAVLIFFTALSAFAQCDCDFIIPLNAYAIDGTKLKGVNGQIGVKPGDKVCFASGTRPDLMITNMTGTASAPIVITNMCDGQVIFRGPSAGTGRLLYMGNCSFVRVSGSANPTVQYGIEMTVGVQAVDFRDRSTDVEADHLYIHDIGYSALNAKTDPTCDPLTWRGNFTMRNISFHDNKITNTGGEGVYIGESHYNTTVPVLCGGLLSLLEEHEVIGAKVYNNIFENIGRDAIQMGSVTSGGEIYNNKITNFGITGEYGQQSGIQINPGTNANIYDNVIDNGTGFGLFAGGRGGSHVYNNIIMNCRQGGIICADYAPLDPSGFIFANNTLINNNIYGIYMLSENTQQNQFVNNIIVGPNESNYQFIKLNNPLKIKWTASNNIQTKDISTVKFINAGAKDLHLQSASPAKDAGIDMRPYGVTKDLDALARPQGGVTDIGAYEFKDSGTNAAPTANAGADKTVTLPTNAVTLTGAGADADGTIATWEWTKVSGGAVTMPSSVSASVTIGGLVEGTYTFRLKVTDNAGATGTDDVIITVKTSGETGTGLVASAGADKTITLPTNTTSLTGSATSGTAMYWEWTKVSGGAATLADAGKPTLNVSGLVAGTYTFRLKITNSAGATATDDVVLTVKAASTGGTTPQANAGADKSITLPTNSVAIAGSGSSTIMYWEWTKVSGGAATLTDVGKPTLNVSGLVAGTYTFRLKVTDNAGAVATDDVILIVNAAPNPTNTAPIAVAGADKTIYLPTNSTILHGKGTDADGTITRLEWTKVSGGTATLANAATTNLTVTGLASGTYVFRLKVTDNGGATATDDVVLTVKAASTGTTLQANAGADKTITLPTNSVAITGSGSSTIIYWEWTKVSGGAATLTNVGKPTLNVSGLVAGTYTFRLKVTDNAGAVATDDVIVIVNAAPKPANIAPTVAAGADKTIYLPTTSTILHGRGTDADGTIARLEWTKVSGGPATLANAATTNLTVTGLATGTYVFRLKVTDNLGATAIDDVTLYVKPATTTSTSTSGRTPSTGYISLAEPVGSFDDPQEPTGTSFTNEEPFAFMDKQFPAGHTYAIIIFDHNGRRIYTGEWSPDRYHTIFPEAGFYVYHIIQDGEKIDAGKVYISR